MFATASLEQVIISSGFTYQYKTKYAQKTLNEKAYYQLWFHLDIYKKCLLEKVKIIPLAINETVLKSLMYLQMVGFFF